MRIFLDTANMEQLRQGARLGVVSGVTTNPTLVAKEGIKDYKSTIKEIAEIFSGPVSAEVIAEDVPGMLKEAHEIAGWASNVVIKIPATANGLEATHALAKDNINVNMTLVFSVNQALLASLAGAAYVSPFIGRLDDASEDGMILIQDIVQVFKNYNYSTQIIAASIRHPLHCVQAAKAGAHIATVPYAILMQMIKHPLTDIGIARFMEDWKKVAKK